MKTVATELYPTEISELKLVKSINFNGSTPSTTSSGYNPQIFIC